MSIEIGEIYKSKHPAADPFATPSYAIIIDVKENEKGDLWLKYKFVEKTSYNTWTEGVLTKAAGRKPWGFNPCG